jgi:predicted nucleotidyltransferase
VSNELAALAEIIGKWLDDAPGVPVAYLFGSRVRGDHRPDSDVDLRLYLQDWTLDAETMRWWMHQNDTDFAELKAKLPGPLALHRETSDAADAAIKAGRATPVLTVRKVVCVWTPARAVQSGALLLTCEPENSPD